MQNFLKDGLMHITDFEGYDHMLFLLALTAPFSFKEWKQVVLLATAFTLGHSVSLGLAASDAIRFSSDLIETLIPITIVLTALGNLIPVGPNPSTQSVWLRYTAAIAFGLIHGMGFSSYFRMISGDGESFIRELFLFNLGVELGQIMIVLCILTIVAIARRVFSTHERAIALALSSVALLLASVLTIDKIFS